jgi:hypothetical protein
MMTDRRHVLSLLLTGLASPAIAQTQSMRGSAMSPVTAYAFSFAGLQGDSIRLADYAGKPIMVVNTASLCGYTPQYTGLERLYTRYHARGLLLVGVPSNDFGGQEPGDATEISATARHAEMEFPQISGRMRRPHRGGVRFGRRADGYAGDRRDRAGAGRLSLRPPAPQHHCAALYGLVG